MIVAAPPPAVAALAFHPPAGQTVGYRVVDVQGQGAAQHRYVSRIDARFDPAAAGGYTLTLTVAPEAGGARFGAMLEAFAAVPLRIRVDAAGRATDVVDADTTWDAAARVVAAGVATATRGQPADAPGPRALRGFSAAFAATPFPVRRATLLANAEFVLGPPGGVAPGAWSGAGTDAGGQPVALTGRLRPVDCAPDLLCLRIDAASAPDAARAGEVVGETVDLSLSRADGLLVRLHRTLRRGDAPAFFEETVTRTP